MRIAFVCAILLAAGCRVGSTTELPAALDGASSLEIARDPMILAKQKARWSEMSLNGVHLGDDEAVISPKKINERNAGGWVILRDANRFHPKDGRIDGIGVWENKLLSRLGVNNREDIETVFGKAKQQIHVSTSVWLYFYEDNHVTVIWNDTEHKLNGVNLTKFGGSTPE